MDGQRVRIRELGMVPGKLPPGTLNAITDVPGVLVGHVTMIDGQDIRTGVTSVLPHGGNLYQDKVPAGIAVGNGFGKLIGFTQVDELGEIETPLVLTNTLAAPRAAGALIQWTLSQLGNEEVRSINPLVGETNDGLLNDIRHIAVDQNTVIRSIEIAASGAVQEGCVGAGTGTVCFGWKGGIGTSSRLVPAEAGGYAVGALVQTNFGGTLSMDALPRERPAATDPAPVDGSIMIVIATDAALSDRNLRRLARRGLAGLARTGAGMSDGSGDYVIAFSVAEEVRRTPDRRSRVWSFPEVPNAHMSPLFQAAIEATEEAIYNSLTMATTMTGYRGITVHALPLDHLVRGS
jgi:D-aminopeptidase